MAGLLLAGAYRADEVDVAHPLAAPLARWREQPAVRDLRLDNLSGPSLAAMVAEMLHTDPATVAGLAGTIEPHTCGYPDETVEPLNALRRDGLLTVTAAGWRGDEAAVHAHLGRSGVASLLAGARRRPAGRSPAGGGGDGVPGRARRAAPAAGRDGRAGRRGRPGAGTRPRRLPAGGTAGAHLAVRFRHDWILEAVRSGPEPSGGALCSWPWRRG